ncbi:MAG: hypothetical protein VCC36_03415 [Gammaproteobacteria bacterium]
MRLVHSESAIIRDTCRPQYSVVSYRSGSHAVVSLSKAFCGARFRVGCLDDLGERERQFGTDSGAWTHDGECDNPRFEGKGMASVLLDDDLYQDASDCRNLMNKGASYDLSATIR